MGHFDTAIASVLDNKIPFAITDVHVLLEHVMQLNQEFKERGLIPVVTSLHEILSMHVNIEVNKDVFQIK